MTTSSSLWFISCALSLSVWAQTPKCAPVPAGLTARYSFDEPAFAAGKATRVAGWVGRAVAFDGDRQFLEIPHSPALNFGSSDFTVELWVRTTDASRSRNILDKRDDSPRGYALFIERGGHPGFQVAAGDPHWTSVAAFRENIADGRWHHIAGVAKRLPMQPPAIYVDGELRATASQKNSPLDSVDNPSPLWLGRHHRNTLVPKDSYFWDGTLDELALYRRALTPAEIKSIYQAGRAGKCR